MVVEFRVRADGLVRSGKPMLRAVAEQGITQACPHHWLGKDRGERAENTGVLAHE